jgi:hypothetical protein
MEDERLWICEGCGFLEFDISEVTVIHKSARKALVLQEGRCHSLKLMRWEDIQKARLLHNECLEANGYWKYTQPKRRAEQDALLEAIHKEQLNARQ